jgi:hypothetical protein
VRLASIIAQHHHHHPLEAALFGAVLSKALRAMALALCNPNAAASLQRVVPTCVHSDALATRIRLLRCTAPLATAPGMPPFATDNTLQHNAANLILQ